ncbi:MAG: YqgE/AlgH family protein [Reinekea sp.]|nr:YqgE/AlgH family protein [Reinekea sp.]
MILDHHFLIAMPEMADPIFAGTVTYILQHDEEGAFGLIVNRPINLDLESVFHSVDIKNFNKKSGQKPVYHGGPVSSEQGFILHRPTERVWDSTLSNNQLCVTTSQDILQAIAYGEGPEKFLFCLGYSGWSGGQLEQELKQNAWLTVAADSDIIFTDNETEKYRQALTLLGVDISALSGHGGLA